MKVHWLQHLPEEGLGSIESWLQTHGHEPICHRLDQRSGLPEARDVEALIVMGGPMSVHDLQAHPWLDAERHLIRRMLQFGRPLLGICLGAQQIAMALGAEVQRAPQPENGWFDVELTAAGRQGPLTGRLPRRFPALHWHGEQFEIPSGAVHLARSELCDAQTFRIGRHALALQFHLEMQADGVRALAEREPPQPSSSVQTAAQMLAAEANFESSRQHMDTVLGELFAVPS